MTTVTFCSGDDDLLPCSDCLADGCTLSGGVLLHKFQMAGSGDIILLLLKSGEECSDDVFEFCGELGM